MMTLSTENAMKFGRKVVDDATKFGHDAWLAGLGIVATLEKEGREVFDQLVEKGKTFKTPDVGQDEIGKFVDTAAERVKDVGQTVEDSLQETTKAVLHRFGMPTHQEIQALIARVEALGAKVEAMAKKGVE